MTYSFKDIKVNLDNPLTVYPDVAKVFGVKEGIVLQQIFYWLKQNHKYNIKNEKNRNVHEGKIWVYNTYKGWKEQDFSWRSVSTIMRILKNLILTGVLIKGNFNKHAYDKTIRYTINYDLFEEFLNKGERFDYKLMREQAKQLMLPKGQNASYQNDKMLVTNLASPIPETIEEIKKETTIINNNSPEKKIPNNTTIDSEDESSPSIESHDFNEGGTEEKEIKKECIPTQDEIDIPKIKKKERGDVDTNKIIRITQEMLEKHGFIYNGTSPKERMRAMNFTQSVKKKEMESFGFTSYEEYIDFLLEKAKKYKILKRPLNSVVGIFYNALNVLNEYQIKYADFDRKVFTHHEWIDEILSRKSDGKLIYNICFAVRELGRGLEQDMNEEKVKEWIAETGGKYPKLSVDLIFDEVEKHRIFYKGRYPEGDYLVSLDKRLDRVSVRL